MLQCQYIAILKSMICVAIHCCQYTCYVFSNFQLESPARLNIFMHPYLIVI